MAILHTSQPHEPWNKGKLVGQKAPLKLKDMRQTKLVRRRRREKRRLSSSWMTSLRVLASSMYA